MRRHVREVRTADRDNRRTGHYAPPTRVEPATGKKRVFIARRSPGKNDMAELTINATVSDIQVGA
jgi:hypothetical protein